MRLCNFQHRRQTRLTALDIIAYAAADQIPDAFLHCDSNEVSEYIGRVSTTWNVMVLIPGR